MPAQVVHTTAPKIESTFKAREVEGFLDLRFYRPTRLSISAIFRAAQGRHRRASVYWRASVGLLPGIFIFTVSRHQHRGHGAHVCANAPG